jgi:thiol:disulfide interchange protein DsbD
MLLVGYSLLQFYGLSVNDNFNPSSSFIEKENKVIFTKLYDTNEVFQSINDAKNITMIDLWADWCVACKELDKYTFSDERVYSLLNKMNIIKFDITENNIDHAQFLNDYKIYGPPALMFFDNDGKEIESARIVGFIDADKFLIKLNQLNID